MAHPLSIKSSLRAAVGVLAIAGLSQCSVNEQVQRAQAFKGVDVRLVSVDQVTLAGIDVTQVRESADLGVTQQAVIGAVYATGKLPLRLRLNLEFRNPNDEDAALNELDYIALLDGKQIATGRTSERLEVRANGGTATAPITLESNLRSALGEQTEATLLTLASGLADQNRQPMRLTLRVRPTFVTHSGRSISPGGYININKDFTVQQAVGALKRQP